MSTVTIELTKDGSVMVIIDPYMPVSQRTLSTIMQVTRAVRQAAEKEDSPK